MHHKRDISNDEQSVVQGVWENEFVGHKHQDEWMLGILANVTFDL